jgi:hypothetical protein
MMSCPKCADIALCPRCGGEMEHAFPSGVIGEYPEGICASCKRYLVKNPFVR